MALFSFRSKNTDESTAAPEARAPGFIARMRAKLNRGDSWLTYDLANLLPGGRIDDAVLDELEMRLVAADVGIDTTQKILEGLRGKVARKELGNLDALLGALRESLLAIVAPVARPLVPDAATRPYVVLVVGVNGSGKTTTIGKLARRWSDEGRKVVLAAGDTFRAAAIDQLQVWSERTGARLVSRPQGADAAGLAFDALTEARAEQADILFIDTAGRLQNKAGLMAELDKIVRVLKKIDASAPHAVLLVLDATTGQNAMAQAEVFAKIAGVSGIIMTKLDGTARGGILVAIAERFKIPVHAIGIGEQIDDLQPFDAEAFAEAIAGGAN